MHASNVLAFQLENMTYVRLGHISCHLLYLQAGLTLGWGQTRILCTLSTVVDSPSSAQARGSCSPQDMKSLCNMHDGHVYETN